MPQFTSIVEPDLVGQTLNKASVETSCVTRRRFVSVAPMRDRVVCIAQDREVDLDLPDRLVAVSLAREVELSAPSRSVVIGPLDPRVVVIPPEETCCE